MPQIPTSATATRSNPMRFIQLFIRAIFPTALPTLAFFFFQIKLIPSWDSLNGIAVGRADCTQHFVSAAFPYFHLCLSFHRGMTCS
jgi:hypothetical protein